MILGSAVLFVVLATSDVNAQTSHEYDLHNCSINTIADQTHHANDPQNCRVFYNCDAANGGKLTLCPEGTIYDAEAGICDSGGDCNIWNQLANCATFPSGVRNFTGQCCNTYYQYYCATRSFQLMYCNPGTWFNAGSCSFQRPTSGCMECNTAPATGDLCTIANLQYVDQCHFKKKGSDVSIPCGEGTSMNRDTCRCDRDPANPCGLPPSKDCTSKKTFNFQTKRFVNGANFNSVPYTMSRSDNGVVLYYLAGQDLLHQPFSFLLRFSLSQPRNGEQTVMSVEDPQNCGGTPVKFELKYTVSSQLYLTVSKNNQRLDMQKPHQLNPNQVYTLKVAFDLQAGVLKAMVDHEQFPGVSAQNGVWTTMREGGTQVCRPKLGPFDGAVSEFSFWRNCTDLNRMN